MAMPATIIAQDNTPATGLALARSCGVGRTLVLMIIGCRNGVGHRVVPISGFESPGCDVPGTRVGHARIPLGVGNRSDGRRPPGGCPSVGSILARVRPERCYGEYRVRNLAYQRLW